MRRLPEILCAAGAIVLVSCGPGQKEASESAGAPTTNVTASDRPAKASEATPGPGDSAVQDKDRLAAAATAKLADWKTKLTDLGQKADVLSGEAKEQANKTLDTLRDKYAAVTQKLETLKQSAREAWPEAKAGLDAAIADLEQAYSNAKAKFEKSP